ncbi:MAG TPA: hypothetical protein VHA70_10320 [Bauldia sp.]|nr:hypothetical protein [Bauldia sp.]
MVHRDIHAKLAQPNGGFPDVQGAVFVTNFVGGGLVSASLRGDPNKNRPDMERLVDLDEVWVACFRRPRDNQWRLMGRFVRQNVFIGLSLYRRRELVDGAYAKKAAEFITRWNSLLAAASVVRSDFVADYLSKPTMDVDARIL